MRSICVGAAAAVAVFATASAQTEAPNPLENIYACADITDDAERLACFDTAVGSFREREGAGEVAVVDREQVREIEREAFGFALPSLPRLAFPRLGGGDEAGPAEEPIEAIDATVERWERLYSGDTRFHLDNGQVWDQTDGRHISLLRNQPNTVRIRRAALGSYLLRLNERGRSIRVRRVE